MPEPRDFLVLYVWACATEGREEGKWETETEILSWGETEWNVWSSWWRVSETLLRLQLWSVCFVLGFFVEGILALRAAAGFSCGSTPHETRRRSYRSVFAIILCWQGLKSVRWIEQHRSGFPKQTRGQRTRRLPTVFTEYWNKTPKDQK